MIHKLRLAKFGLLIVCAYAALTGAEAHVQVKRVRPLLGTLVVSVPRGMLRSENYWIYVNSQIVSGPPHKAFTDPGFLKISASRLAHADQLWGPEGQIASSLNGRLTYVKAGMRDQIIQNQSFQLAPGIYNVEIMARATDQEGFPFTLTGMKIQVVAGKTAAAEFGVPPAANETPRAARAARAYDFGSKKQTLTSILDDVNIAIKNYEMDPIVEPLNKILLNLSISPPSQPKVFAALPDSMGGNRQLDITQITLIIENLESNYSFNDQGALDGARDVNPELGEYIEERIANHNKRMANLREILKLLVQAKK